MEIGIKITVNIQCIKISLAEKLFSYRRTVSLSHLAMHELQLLDLLRIGDFFSEKNCCDRNLNLNSVSAFFISPFTDLGSFILDSDTIC